MTLYWKAKYFITSQALTTNNLHCNITIAEAITAEVVEAVVDPEETVLTCMIDTMMKG